MQRNTLLLIASILAIVAGLLVSYFPPTQNAVAIWSLVNLCVGYGIRDLFVIDAPAAAPTPAAQAVPPAPAPVVSPVTPPVV